MPSMDYEPDIVSWSSTVLAVTSASIKLVDSNLERDEVTGRLPGIVSAGKPSEKQSFHCIRSAPGHLLVSSSGLSPFFHYALHSPAYAGTAVTQSLALKSSGRGSQSLLLPTMDDWCDLSAMS